MQLQDNDDDIYYTHYHDSTHHWLVKMNEVEVGVKDAYREGERKWLLCLKCVWVRRVKNVDWCPRIRLSLLETY